MELLLVILGGTATVMGGDWAGPTYQGIATVVAGLCATGTGLTMLLSQRDSRISKAQAS